MCVSVCGLSVQITKNQTEPRRIEVSRNKNVLNGGDGDGGVSTIEH